MSSTLQLVIVLTSPLPLQPRRLMATDWPVNIALLHHFSTSRLFRGNSLYRGGIDAGYGVETPLGETRMSPYCQCYGSAVG